jgi:aminoglycoside/choline kinase family phosphotransferase
VSAALSSIPAGLRAFLGDRMGECEVEPLAGDASTRRYFRVRGAAGSRVAALYPEPFDVPSSSFATVRDLLDGYGVPVPRLLDHDGRLGVLLLEDLGDVTLQELVGFAGPAGRDALYDEALRDLARLQRAAQAGPRTAACFSLAFDVEKLSWELGFFREHFVEGHRGARLSEPERSELAALFHELCEEIAAWPRVLCHRDFHSRNLMQHASRLCWIDFQDARLGPAQYDPVSLLCDSYVELSPGFVAEKAEAFRRVAVPDEPREVFTRRFELMAVQRNLKALGTFGYMATRRGNPSYVPYMAGTLASARRNLARHPELQPLRRVLARHLQELS